MSDQLDQAAIRAWTRRTRAAQGLPPKFGEATIRRLVALALAGSGGDQHTTATSTPTRPSVREQQATHP